MIADVIREAKTKHEIYFLLTAYVEAVRFCDKLNCTSEHITRLPINGVADVRARFEKLMIELDAASKRLDDKSCEVIHEAVHVFGAVLNRLQLLDEEHYQSSAGMAAQAA